MMRKAFTGTALLLALIGTSASAQTNGIPREFPPEDFAGNQFVDSEGCAFIRAGISGNTQWVPRVDSQRRQLCNYQPTFAIAEAPAASPVEDTPAAASGLSIETVEATPAPTEPAIGDLPLITIPSAAEAAASSSPVRVPVPRTDTAPAPSPRVIAAAPAAPAEESIPAEAAAPTVTLSQVCEGKFGPQPGFISSSTGETIDCGPAPTVAAVTAPVPAPAAQPEPLRMTLAEICEAAKVGDRRFVDAATGEPISCPSAIQVARAPATEPVSTPAPAQAAVASVASACPEIPAAEGQTVRCGPQVKRPWTAANSDGESSRARAIGLGLGGTPIPASNPAPGAVAAQPSVPAGYQPAFNDGRHNAQRGLPASANASVQATQVSARGALALASPYKYVQVGSFGVHSNADNLLARLQAMGLGTASGRSGALKIVAVGPFSSAADMQNALGAMRAMGFPDAFPRN